MKNKNFYFFALVAGMVFYACSQYTGREAVKPKQESVYQNTSLPLEALLVIDPNYIAYMAVLDNPNSTWQQAVAARDLVLATFGGFEGLTEAQIDAIFDASFDWMDSGNGNPILIPLADHCKSCLKKAARKFEKAVKAIAKDPSNAVSDYAAAELVYITEVGACYQSAACN